MTSPRAISRTPYGEVTYTYFGSGPPLVHLHPRAGWRLTPAMELLSGHWTVYSPIAPGFDGTPQLAGVEDLPQLADAMAGFVSATVGEPVGVVGHSFGALVAIWLATRHPDLVRNVVLEAPPIRPAGVETEHVTAADLYYFVERASRFLKPSDVLAQNRRAAKQYRDKTKEDVRAGGLCAPLNRDVLAIVGTEDPLVSLKAIEEFASSLPSARVKVIGQASHNIEVDQPEVFSSVAHQFLQGG